MILGREVDTGLVALPIYAKELASIFHNSRDPGCGLHERGGVAREGAYIANEAGVVVAEATVTPNFGTAKSNLLLVPTDHGHVHTALACTIK